MDFVLKTMLALILSGALLCAAFAILMFLIFIFAKIHDVVDTKREKKLRKKHPDYYQLLDEYTASRHAEKEFLAENINQLKCRIDRLSKEIQYLPKAHIVEQEQEIEILKQMIYDNTWVYKKMAHDNSERKQKLKVLQEKYCLK